MRVSVFGCGYLGAVHAVTMTELGHEVVGIDVDDRKLDALSRAVPPFYEPGFEHLLSRALSTGRLQFSADVTAAKGSRVHFVCVGTPQKRGEYGADLRYVEDAVESLVTVLAPGDLVAGKSTVPVGTAARLAALIEREVPGAMLAWNPEFLREGFAVRDTLHPDRLVYGLPAGPAREIARALLDEVYRSVVDRDTPVVVTDYATAEMVKAAANSFLATKISFINAMAELCEATGADVGQLADAIGHDDRIGRRFLDAGLGFGGGCLPKDIRAFMARAEELGAQDALAFLEEVDAINMRRRARAIDLGRELLDGDYAGKRVCVWGAAFKPNSDDIRDSPALDVAAAAQKLGAAVIVYDPEAMENAKRTYPQLAMASSALEAARNADVLLLLTEWSEFRETDPTMLASVVAAPRIVDGRNALDPATWRAAGWTYRALGRP